MKKNYVRLFAVLMCAVMLFGLVPAKAKAVELDGKKMPQMDAISYVPEWDTYYITEFADLLQIVNEANVNHQKNYYIFYNSGKSITINESLTLSPNISFQCEGELVIPTTRTLAMEGSLYCKALTVNGKINVGEGAFLHVEEALNNHGVIDLNGQLKYSQDTQVTGNGKLTYYYAGWVNYSCYFTNGTQLQEIADKANACTERWQWLATPRANDIFVSEPVELPSSVVLELYGDDFQISGAPITVNGYLDVFLDGNTYRINNDLILNYNSSIYSNENNTAVSMMIFGGNVTNNGLMNIYAPTTFESVLRNYQSIDILYDWGGKTYFVQPQGYYDDKGGEYGVIWIDSAEQNIPADAISGMNVKDFKICNYYTDMQIPYWALMNYKSTSTQPPVHVHFPVTLPAVAPTCLTPGCTESLVCGNCCETLLKQETLAALGHDYGLGADGKPDFWDTTCDVCGAERKVDKFRPTHSMYRMYNPNSGEHFYTGDKTERQVLEAAGWKYEGVGFTFPASTGKPVYRLFQPSTGEHLYTMSEKEKADLLAAGWNYEGIAFNSGNENEVPQYRLYNPNVTVGAYHFTASTEERNVLLAAGWQDQGIGFYTCWQ